MFLRIQLLRLFIGLGVREHMKDDEREMLTRVDERVEVMSLKHSTCDIPLRLRALENDRNKFVGILMLILAVSTVNTIIDLALKVIYHKV
jgi:hypothetical protein